MQSNRDGSKKKTVVLHDIENYLLFGGMNNELPFIWPTILFLSKFIPRLRPLATVFEQLHEEYGPIAVENTQKYLENNRGGAANRTLFAGMILQAESEGNSFDIRDCATWASGMALAGTDTTSVTLTYLVWAVLTHPRVHQKLLAEIERYPETTSFDQLSTKLEYLGHVIDETMRLWPVAPGSLYRTAPLPTSGTVLAGYRIPRGTTVDTQAWTFHRDPQFFPDPLTFDPDR